ncbi:MAG: hypothetical protein ACRC28_00105 [Clostridium sp.]|uniref:hypothetical protein n=1 Tax=Clostridium sp. TaxID=1506 RepID=UPI003F36A7FC
MANLNQEYSIQNADVVTQLTGLGSQMGVDIIIKAPAGKTITVETGSTIQLDWVDTTGAKKFAKVLTAGTINDSTGITFGPYYPDGVVFEDQAAVDAFFTTDVTAKIYKATIA